MGDARMFRAAAALVLVSLLAGCGQQPSAGAPENATAAQRSIRIRNEWQEKLLALSDLDRELALRRAVRDDGGSCPKITGSKYQQDYQGMAMWVAYCSSGDWAVYVS